MRDRADADNIFARMNDDHGAGAILSPFGMPFAIFVTPKIGVVDYIPWRYRNGIGQSVDLVVEIGGFCRRLGCLEKPDCVFVELTRQNNPTVSGL